MNFYIGQISLRVCVCWCLYQSKSGLPNDICLWEVKLLAAAKHRHKKLSSLTLFLSNKAFICKTELVDELRAVSVRLSKDVHDCLGLFVLLQGFTVEYPMSEFHCSKTIDRPVWIFWICKFGHLVVFLPSVSLSEKWYSRVSENWWCGAKLTISGSILISLKHGKIPNSKN